MKIACCVEWQGYKLLWTLSFKFVQTARGNKHSPEGSHDLVVDCFQYLLRSIEFQQEHIEDTMVGQLLEVGVTDLMVLEEDTSNNAKNL